MKAIPDYAAMPLRGFLSYMKASMRLLHMSMGGIGMITSIPRGLKALGEHDYADDVPSDPVKRKEGFEKELKVAETRAKFAAKELADGFPLLHAHTLVGIWSAFESAMEDALVGVLMNESNWLQSETFFKVRIPLAEFEALEKEERIRFLIQEIERHHSPSQKRGVEGFERLLGYINLSGAVDPDIKKTIWELSHIRNVIVHRGSVADRRLVQSCPWLGLKVGDKVTVTHDVVGKYYHALGEYLTTVLYRLCTRYEIDIEEKLRSDPKDLTLTEDPESLF
jgi:hypothetical protein